MLYFKKEKETVLPVRERQLLGACFRGWLSAPPPPEVTLVGTPPSHPRSARRDVNFTARLSTLPRQNTGFPRVTNLGNPGWMRAKLLELKSVRAVGLHRGQSREGLPVEPASTTPFQLTSPAAPALMEPMSGGTYGQVWSDIGTNGPLSW